LWFPLSLPQIKKVEHSNLDSGGKVFAKCSDSDDIFQQVPKLNEELVRILLLLSSCFSFFFSVVFFFVVVVFFCCCCCVCYMLRLPFRTNRV
jgi:hypothetical protein